VPVAGCAVAAALYWSQRTIDGQTVEPSATASYRSPSATGGTLRKTARSPDEFSFKRAFTTLYNNYDPNLDGAFWTPTGGREKFAQWNGKTLFIRPLVTRSFREGTSIRQLLITNSLDVRNGDVVKQGTGCRACGSLIGAAIFEKQQSDWKLISRHDFLTADGSWGSPPRVSVSFPKRGEIVLDFEHRSADQREPRTRSYAIVLKERDALGPELARTNSRAAEKNSPILTTD
jgi:hypothetical protein